MIAGRIFKFTQDMSPITILLGSIHPHPPDVHYVGKIIIASETYYIKIKKKKVILREKENGRERRDFYESILGRGECEADARI